jgi:large subunit ribosomal protein L31
MKSGIHPTYHEEATIVCSCGNKITTGSTSESLRIDLCSKCHPFYTGQQKLVDTEGQVDRFMQRMRRSKRLQE